MTGPPLRSVRAGDVLSARWLNALLALALSAARIRVGPGLVVRRDTSGTFIGLQGRPLERFVAKITGATLDATNQWSYAFVRMQAVDDAYGTGFVDRGAAVAGLRTGTARNLAEWDSSATQAGGVDLTRADYTDTTLAPVRVPDGALVMIEALRYTDAETGAGRVAFWFERAVAHDGGCGTGGGGAT